jgi:hypothetical protein
MNTGGLALLTWDNSSESKDSSMISGFLTALNMFAVGERGEQLKKINLDPTTFLFEREKDILFVVLTKDHDAEKIVKMFLPEIRSEFFKEYQSQIENFSGEMNQFLPFKSKIDNILRKYGFFEYLKIKSQFNSEVEYKCVLFIDRNNGDILYLKAKEYIDRNTLGYLSTVFLNVATRILVNGLNEDMKLLILLSENGRSIQIRYTEKIIFVQEKQLPISKNAFSSQIDEKKLKNTIKKPGKVLFESSLHFALLDQSGKIVLTNDREKSLKADQLSADLVTIFMNARNVLKQVYKDKFYLGLLISSKNVYGIVPLNEFNVFVQVGSDIYKKLTPLIDKIQDCQIKSCEEQITLDEIILPLEKLKDLFQ